MIFDTHKDYFLENEKVLLRPLKQDDTEYLLPYSLKEPEIWTYSLVSAAGEANLNNYMEHALSKRENGDSYPFIVWDKKSKTYVGSTRFYDIQRLHETVQLGYTWLGKKSQRTGINRNCKYLLLEFAFETLGALRVEFRADAKNSRSIAAMKGLGCTFEGILRSNCKSSNGRRDSIVLSILKDEWLDGIKDQLKSRI